MSLLQQHNISNDELEMYRNLIEETLTKRHLENGDLIDIHVFSALVAFYIDCGDISAGRISKLFENTPLDDIKTDQKINLSKLIQKLK
ncbi:MAG: hypothetical protein MHPSP_002601, partial [Paramarteilia canceri]